MRLNPDFDSKKGMEKVCLEFYIPQLCSYYLQSNTPSTLHFELMEFIFAACQKSPFFAHKVFFFFNAALDQYPVKAQKMLEDLSDFMKQTEHQLYLVNERAFRDKM